MKCPSLMQKSTVNGSHATGVLVEDRGIGMDVDVDVGVGSNTVGKIVGRL
jgi:hypothetical protein